ncbi:MAG: ribokinase [Planctomycetota bacterium]|nr:ribokinase [Planctomycetota bacterium]
MSPAHSITVIGSINVDFVVRADRLPAAGESVVGHEFFQAFGGKGANQAVGIARLGRAKVNFVAAVGGDDIGKSGLASLARENISTEFVREVQDADSGVALIMIDAAGENCITAAPGANAFVDENYIRCLPDSLFRESSLIVICQEIPLEAIRVAVERAKQGGVPVLFNPAPPNERLADSEVLSMVDYLTPNETEVEAITGIRIDGPDDDAGKLAALRILVEKGARRVAITMGRAGCFVYDPGEMEGLESALQVSAPVTTAVDTTAAGDSFNAALAVGLVNQLDFLEACRWANRVAAFSVTRKGAQPSLPTTEELEAHYRD